MLGTVVRTEGEQVRSGERKGRAAPEMPGCGSGNTEKRRNLGQQINKEVLKYLPVAVTQAPAPPAALIWVPLVWGNSTYSLCRTDPPPHCCWEAPGPVSVCYLRTGTAPRGTWG